MFLHRRLGFIWPKQGWWVFVLGLALVFERREAVTLEGPLEPSLTLGNAEDR